MKRAKKKKFILCNHEITLWNFFNFSFQKSYWLGRHKQNRQEETVRPPVQDSSFFEKEPQGVSAGVQVKGLTKVWKACYFGY